MRPTTPLSSTSLVFPLLQHLHLMRLLWLLAFYTYALRLLFIGYALWPVAMQLRYHTHVALDLACNIRFLRETLPCRFTDRTVSQSHYVDAIQTEFWGLESLASGATEIAPLTQSLSEARLSIDNLIVVVKLSSFASRAALVEELLVISSETKDASRNLQKLFAEIQAAIDIMVIVNEHLLELLDTRISPISGLAAYCYAVGNTLRSSECSSSHLRISEAYDQTLNQFQEVLSVLLIRVTQVQGNLDGIEAKLGVIRDLVTLETGNVMSDKSDVLTQILALLRLPSERAMRLESQLQSLTKITHYRILALRYVIGTMEGLQELAESMEVLRSMALGATLLDGVPMEVIIASLSKGIERVRLVNNPSFHASSSLARLP